MNKKKIIIALIIIVLIVIAILGIIQVRKVFIFNSLLDKAAETRKATNYYMELNSKENGGTLTQVWEKDETHYLTKIITPNISMVFYQNGDEKFRITDTQGHKLVHKDKGGTIELYTFASFVNTNHVWREAIKSTLRSIKFENKDCYEIKLENGDNVIVEKLTGLVLKGANGEGKYELNTVTDADIQKPDLTGYIEQ